MNTTLEDRKAAAVKPIQDRRAAEEKAGREVLKRLGQALAEVAQADRAAAEKIGEKGYEEAEQRQVQAEVRRRNVQARIGELAEKLPAEWRLEALEAEAAAEEQYEQELRAQVQKLDREALEETDPLRYQMLVGKRKTHQDELDGGAHFGQGHLRGARNEVQRQQRQRQEAHGLSASAKLTREEFLAGLKDPSAVADYFAACQIALHREDLGRACRHLELTTGAWKEPVVTLEARRGWREYFCVTIATLDAGDGRRQSTVLLEEKGPALEPGPSQPTEARMMMSGGSR